MIISLHTPKAAGTSFKSILKSFYESSYIEDYRDYPINSTIQKSKLKAIKFYFEFLLFKYDQYKKQNIKCIHGHFLPYKYSILLENKEALFITWLRDPVERLYSHYFYWIKTYDKSKSFGLHKRVIEENWDLETFCFSKEMRNVYSKLLWKFPIQNFHFVGITEYFEADFLYFANQFLGIDPNDIPKLNINSNSTRDASLSEDLIKKLKKINDKDYAIYETALAMRKNRININLQSN